MKKREEKNEKRQTKTKKENKGKTGNELSTVLRTQERENVY